MRRRLALYGAMVTAVAMLIFGVLLGMLATNAAPADQEKTLTALALESAASFAVAPPQILDEVVPLLATDAAASTEQFVALVTEEAEVLFTTGLIAGSVPEIPGFVVAEARQTGSASAVLDLGGTEVRIHAVPFDRDDLGITGAVVAAQPTSFIEEQLAGLRAFIFFSGVVTLLVASMVGWLISRRALKPLQVLAETTDEIGRTGDLTRRLEPSTARDEVGRLTTSFNEMLDRVASAQAQLESSLEAQRRFVADASHELRSPLTTVRNNSGFLLGHPEADGRDRTEAISDIAAEAERMATLVDDLLELASADSRPARPPRPVALKAVVESAAHRAQRHGHHVELIVSGDPVAPGDFDGLARMVWILVHNATSHGDGSVEVGISETDGFATITVSDRGPGIPEDELDQVFERFHRSDPARSPAGAGLGLSIAQSIVRTHAGSITLANRVGGGLTATVTLPV